MINHRCICWQRTTICQRKFAKQIDFQIVVSDIKRKDLNMSVGGERISVASLLAGEGAQVVKSEDGQVC